LSRKAGRRWYDAGDEDSTLMTFDAAAAMFARLGTVLEVETVC
jgi:hypothetical protein